MAASSSANCFSRASSASCSGVGNAVVYLKDVSAGVDYVPNVAREQTVDVALSNAMGLGGHNGCVLFGRA